MVQPKPSVVSRNSPYTVYPGIAGEDLIRGSMSLRIIAPDITPHAPYGDVGAAESTATVSMNTRDGGSSNADLKIANHIVATWDGNGFQRYPPMIRKGEPVEVFRRDNQDKWYFRETARGKNFRSTDIMSFGVSSTATNNPTKRTNDDASMDAIKDDTTQWAGEINTVDQKAWFKSSKANGEACAFNVTMDMKQGTFSLTDDSKNPGNRLFIDTGTKSGKPVFQVNLTTGITLKFDNEDGYIQIPKRLFVNAGDRIVFNTPTTIFNTKKAGAFIINAANMTINMTKDLVVNAGGVFGVNSASSKFSGVVIAAGYRGLSFITGAVMALYKGTSVADVEKSVPTDPSNSADTDLSSGGDRTATAAEQFSEAMSAITGFFGEAQVSVGGALTSIAKKAFMNNIKGK